MNMQSVAELLLKLLGIFFIATAFNQLVYTIGLVVSEDGVSGWLISEFTLIVGPLITALILIKKAGSISACIMPDQCNSE